MAPNAIFVSLSNSISIGRMIGKLKIAINVAFWLALDEIAEIKVKVIEKPKLPNNIVDQNRVLC